MHAVTYHHCTTMHAVNTSSFLVLGMRACVYLPPAVMRLSARVCVCVCVCVQILGDDGSQLYSQAIDLAAQVASKARGAVIGTKHVMLHARYYMGHSQAEPAPRSQVDSSPCPGPLHGATLLARLTRGAHVLCARREIGNTAESLKYIGKNTPCCITVCVA